VQQDSSGAHVLTDLYKDGHNVTALVRNDDQADIVAARGATPTVFDLYDRAAVVSVLGDADGAIHTASPGDATSADLDSAVVDAAIDACAGTGKPFIEISSQWVHGANTSITEESLFQAPALVAWKEPIERRVLGAKDMRDVVVVSGVVYGDGGGGMPGLLLGSPRDDQGNLIMLGTGQRHWSTVHVADLADFFRRVLEHDAARGYYAGYRQCIEPDRSRLRRDGRRRGRRSGSGPRLRRSDRILTRHASVVVVKSLPHAGGRCNEAPGQPGERGRVPRYVSRGTTSGASVRSKAAENR
jgi:uncharacterized protein YbjT (DUF2867 family)